MRMPKTIDIFCVSHVGSGWRIVVMVLKALYSTRLQVLSFAGIVFSRLLFDRRVTALDRTERSGSRNFSRVLVVRRVDQSRNSPKKMLRPRQRAVEFGITPGVCSLGEIYYFVIEIFNTSHREKILLRSNFPDNVRISSWGSTQYSTQSWRRNLREN